MKNRRKLATFHIDLVTNMLSLNMQEEEHFKELISTEFAGTFYNTQRKDEDAEAVSETEVVQGEDTDLEDKAATINVFDIATFPKMVMDNAQAIDYRRLQKLVMVVQAAKLDQESEEFKDMVTAIVNSVNSSSEDKSSLTKHHETVKDLRKMNIILESQGQPIFDFVPKEDSD